MITVEQIEQWQGEPVLDSDGEQLGKVADVFYDAGSGEPVLLAVKSGLLGRHSRLVPLDGASVGRGHVRVAHTQAQVEGSGDAGEDGAIDEATLERLESAYGVKFAANVELWSATEMEARRVEAQDARRRADELEREAHVKLAEHEAAKQHAEGATSNAEAAERAAAKAREAALEARRQAERYSG
jgi:sporulation protein YlmC with PRC-barrel domain